ncbi:MAG: hypothetical protein J5588_10630 [Bacteroidales bacterium]|nr:hypothetical protein [Bacteroidales bacterium]
MMAVGLSYYGSRHKMFVTIDGCHVVTALQPTIMEIIGIRNVCINPCAHRL